jgi:hypothetical protein
MTDNVIRDHFDDLISPGPRVEWLERWLLNEVWTEERYEALNPLDYLNEGERTVNELEEVIASSAGRLYDELLEDPPPQRDIARMIGKEPSIAIAIFDGLSLREVPLVVKLAGEAGISVLETGVSRSVIPTETIDFIDKRMRFESIAPSLLPKRKELREAGIAAYYYNQPSQRHSLDPDARALFLWSAFPDNTYSDSGARFPRFFEQTHELLKTAWLNTVQQVPRGRKIVVTSDHGYVYFGAGLCFARSNLELRPLSGYLGGERFKRLTPPSLSARAKDAEGKGDGPPSHPDLAIYPDRGVAVIRGRVQTHPPGKAASRLYKHGGLSIMEILVPWIVLES